ncbi:hypothetical protein SAMN05443668_12464 [Cryptosporangium aurantiacum]|uniref:ABC-2 family transporter protein n=2 Tax=Cryptosporangium aurantiacum TaxID=134849 RepID=A0A1M7RN63_9ACTN|nr:hypothetical protein SAMN05443668_12464 [Cryptosporangium aurantiacum]
MSGLAWFTWRQQRSIVVAGLAVVAGIALAGYIETHLTFHLLAASNTRALAAFLPAALGVFWGAPLLARPLENHTADLIWTQTVPRVRWFAAALVGLGVATIGVALAVRAILSAVLADRFDGHYTHDVVSVAAIGYACFAVALGVFAGAAIGRVEPAMVVTLLVYAVVRFAGGEVRWREPDWWHRDDLPWIELAAYGGLAAALIAGAFVVVARRGTGR